MTVSGPAVLVVEGDPGSRALADRLSLPLWGKERDPPPPPEALLLCIVGGRLTLRTASAPDRGGITAEYTTILARPATNRQPLLRALGPTSHVVLDATAGLGHDTVLIASAGRAVIAAERHPVLHALIADGLARLAGGAQIGRGGGVHGAALAARIETHCIDARHLLAKATCTPDAIYLDPMYPPKPGKRAHALPPLSMRLTRALAGDDHDTAELLAAARSSGAPRVVVKRPHHAPPVAPDVTFSIKSNLVRYDCFVCAPCL